MHNQVSVMRGIEIFQGYNQPTLIGQGNGEDQIP